MVLPKYNWKEDYCYYHLTFSEASASKSQTRDQPKVSAGWSCMVAILCRATRMTDKVNAVDDSPASADCRDLLFWARTHDTSSQCSESALQVSYCAVSHVAVSVREHMLKCQRWTRHMGDRHQLPLTEPRGAWTCSSDTRIKYLIIRNEIRKLLKQYEPQVDAAKCAIKVLAHNNTIYLGKVKLMQGHPELYR